MKLDIIARGYPNLYSTPNNLPITDTVTVINPISVLLLQMSKSILFGIL